LLFRSVIAQRLARKLCEKCRESYAVGSLERSLLGLKATDRQKTIYRAKTCKACDGTGYKGRMSMVEVLLFDSEMDEILARRGSQSELLRVALSKGFKTLLEVGTERVLDGSSSLEEITRVVDLSTRLKQS